MIEILINVGERKGYGRKVDLWGVGIIMFSILGGYPPFWAEEDEETYQKILQGDPGYIPEYWNPVSTEAKDLLRQLFTVDPKKRPSASECLKHAWYISCSAKLLSRFDFLIPEFTFLFFVFRFQADVSSGADLSLAQKRLIARRRWGRAINAIRSTVRMRLLFKGNNSDNLRITSSDLKGKGSGSSS